MQKSRKKKSEFDVEYPPEPPSPPAPRNDYTLPDTGDDGEETIDGNRFDNEETIDGSDKGLRLAFEITFNGQTERVERILTGQLILGRGSECDVDVVLQSSLEVRKETSRKHAFILDRPDGLYVKDNSKNKTYLNGTEVTGEVALRDEDVLQMGKSTVKVEILGY